MPMYSLSSPPPVLTSVEQIRSSLGRSLTTSVKMSYRARTSVRRIYGDIISGERGLRGAPRRVASRGSLPAPKLQRQRPLNLLRAPEDCDPEMPEEGLFLSPGLRSPEALYAPGLCRPEALCALGLCRPEALLSPGFCCPEALLAPARGLPDFLGEGWTKRGALAAHERGTAEANVGQGIPSLLCHDPKGAH